MSGTYTNILPAEMDAFLTPLGFKLLDLPGTTELVYGKRVHHPTDKTLQLTLRIYTGIAHGQSREKGADAIRPVLFWRNAEGTIKLIGEGKRVHRIATWRKNLKARLDSTNELLPKHVCQDCKAPMVERKGNNGSFYGCVNYPKCKCTRSGNGNA